MEPNTTTSNTEIKEKNICAHGNEDHCCSCTGCGKECFKSNKGYFIRRWVSLLIGVLLAFWVGMKLGEIKGFIYGSYGMVPMHQNRMMGGWNNGR